MDSLYNRYASALNSIAVEGKKVEIYRTKIKMVKKLIAENEELIHLLSSCFITEEEKEKVIDQIFKDEEEQDIVNFIKVIVHNKRAKEMKRICDEYIKISNAELGIKDGIIYSTEKLEEQEITKVEKKLSEVLKTKVELVNEIDQRLIGGIKVVIGDKVFDGSLKNKIESLKASLIAGGK